MEPTARFAEALTHGEGAVRLDEAALLIAAHARPDLDVDEELIRLDRLAATCPGSDLDALVHHLFVAIGFRGDRLTYHDPRNSYLDQVVRRRQGIPISLSVLAMAVGDRIGAPVVGVGMPGHFLLRDQADPGRFVDPFAGGTVLDRAGCERAFRQVQGDDAPFDPAFLAPVGPFAILARMLANLRVTFAARGDHRSIVWVLRLRTLIPGVAAEERGVLAAALAEIGEFRAAAVELDALAALLGGALGEDCTQRAAQLRARLN